MDNEYYKLDLSIVDKMYPLKLKKNKNGKYVVSVIEDKNNE